MGKVKQVTYLKYTVIAYEPEEPGLKLNSNLGTCIWQVVRLHSKALRWQNNVWHTSWKLIWLKWSSSELCLIQYSAFHSMLQFVPKVEKTGNSFLDQLLSTLYMVIHTYQDKHRVQCEQHQLETALNWEDNVVFSSKDKTKKIMQRWVVYYRYGNHNRNE